MTIASPITPHEAISVRPQVAAQMLGISLRSLWGLTDRGELPRIKTGRMVIYRVTDLHAFLDSRVGTSQQVQTARSDS